MRKFNRRLHWLMASAIAIALCATFIPSASAQDEQVQAVNGEKVPAEYVSIHVDGGAMRQVLNSFAMQANRNIVLGPDVTNDLVTIHLNNVQWDNALDVILKPYGYGYQKVGKTLVVRKLSAMVVQAALEPLQSRVYELRYLDAGDVKDIITAQLSPSRGKMSIITARGQKGWKNLASKSSKSKSGGSLDLRAREEEDQIRSKTIVVTDVPSVLNSVAETLAEIDLMPKQVLVEARFMEVNEDFLRDIGVQMAGTFNVSGATIGLGDQFFGATPNAFKPLSGEVGGTYSPGGSNPALNTGGGLLAYGSKWAVFVAMLEEDEDTKTLSAPKILTLNNQEAVIVVGTRYPIISSETTTSTGNDPTISEELEYYESIGIQLNVVPQICDDGYINMITRPSVTEIIGEKGVNEYPIIKTRDTETQTLVANGETIVIGGLLEERETEGVFKVPFLGDIPFLGHLFKRTTKDTKTIDLLIFLSATIVDEDNYDIILEQPEEEEEVIEIDVMEGEFVEAGTDPIVVAEAAPVSASSDVEDIIAELE